MLDPNLQHHRNLTIRCFRVISRILVGAESYSSAEKYLVYYKATLDKKNYGVNNNNNNKKKKNRGD